MINTVYHTNFFTVDGQTLCYGKPTISHTNDKILCANMLSLTIPT